MLNKGTLRNCLLQWDFSFNPPRSNSSWSHSPQPLFAPVLPFTLWTSDDLHSFCRSGFVRVSSDLHEHRGCAWGVQLPLCWEQSLRRRFQYHAAHIRCSKFCPSYLTLHSYRAASWSYDLEIINFCWVLETCYFRLYFLWNTLFYFLLYWYIHL